MSLNFEEYFLRWNIVFLEVCNLLYAIQMDMLL